MRGFRQKIAFGHDIVMAFASIPISLFLRLGHDFVSYDHQFIFTSSILFTAVAAIIFWSMRLYGGIWRYASLNDMVAITKAVTLAILVFLPLMFLVNRLEAMPRSSLLINWFVLIALLGGPRFIYRRFKDWRLGREADEQPITMIPVLLVGAGDASELFIRALERNRRASYRVVGIVDEKGHRVGRNIHGVHVRGTPADIPAIFERLTKEGQRPQRIIVTKAELDKEMMQELIGVADKMGVALARMPRLTDFRSGSETSTEITPIAIEDVLGRAQQVLDRASMQSLVQGRRVLITGAGGTIGGELARQVAAFEPTHLALLDHSEYALYGIDLEIGETFGLLSKSAVIADVRDEDRILKILGDEKPDLVFHAAALKHVPIVEAHPDEGVLTNVLGTRIMADSCRRSGVDAMVLISTDKAVNPTSIMGATKRIAETWCQAVDLEETAKAGDGAHGTRYITVRFGNVLGSTGSVVPLFQRQLAAGGPLTVTHPDMKRYFMTVREAVELVLEATVLGTRDNRGAGRVYVLDMGEPVQIVDLARQMILLSGLRPDEDIKIEFTGMRPGEKLYEEILHDSEPPSPTDYDGIMLAAPRTSSTEELEALITALVAAAKTGEADEIIRLIREQVPEFQPESGGPIRIVASS